MADDIYRDLTMIFRDVFLRDDLNLMPMMSAPDIAGWDSMRQIEIILAAEEKWGIKFSTRELDSLRTVGDLVAVIGAKR